jgi:hypothetical protein
MGLGGGAHFGGMAMHGMGGPGVAHFGGPAMHLGGPAVTFAGPRGNFVGPTTAFANPGMRGNRFAGSWGHGRFGRDFRHRRFFDGAIAGLYGLGLGYDLGYGVYGNG